MQLIDIGANLAHDSFDDDRDEVIQRAFAAGVSQLVITGSCLQSSQDALSIARTYPGQVYATAGLHPHHATDYDTAHEQAFRALAAEPEVRALGEAGLDFFRDFSPRPDQEKAFVAQLELAAELNKPVFLHQRDAHDCFMPILDHYLDHLPAAVVHCFTGSEAELNDYLQRDLHIGITGWICDERRGQHLKAIVKRIPTNRLMIETDAPYLLPRTICPKPGSRRNEPAYLSYVLQTVSEATGRPLQELAEQTTQTARDFFAIDSD